MTTRSEPLIRERLWAFAPGLASGVTAETEYDEAGRPVCTRYEGVRQGYELYTVDAETHRRRDAARRARADPEERYHYDEGGRLVRIDEAEALWATADQGQRTETGGALSVEHDAHGPLRILGPENGLIWQRSDEPWPELLARGAREAAAQAIALVRECCASQQIDPGIEVFALMLTYVDQGSLHVDLAFGLEQERRAWLRAGLDAEEHASRLWYVDDYLFGEGVGGGLRHIEGDVPDDDLDNHLLCHAAIAQPEDPYRVVLTAVAAELARHDWSELVTLTPDFVVFIAEHDEGYRPKAESVRAANPPERVAAWDANWPAGVSRGEDEGW